MRASWAILRKLMCYVAIKNFGKYEGMMMHRDGDEKRSFVERLHDMEK